MTLHRLNEHREIVVALREAEEQLQRLECKVLGASSIDGMPHGTGSSDKVGTLAIILAANRETVADLKQQVKASEAGITEWMNLIPKEEPLTYNIFALRFLMGMEWSEVAGIVGGGNTADAVKAVCYRYLFRSREETA